MLKKIIKLGAKELRVTRPTPQQLRRVNRLPLYLILDNVLDTYNIGGLFRLADAVAARKLILCGGSETPPSTRIHKAAVGTEEWVEWGYEPDAYTAIQNLKLTIHKLVVIAIEQSHKSIPVTKYELPEGTEAVAIIVGHETDGIAKEVLDIADTILEIPMFGVNKSLNVIVSAAIGTYKILENLKK